MAYKCDNCGRGVQRGKMVSHAKNRLARLFKPNLQKLKVFKNGIYIRVRFCTSCIQALKNKNQMGPFVLKKMIPTLKVSVSAQKKIEKVKPEIKKESKTPTLDISAIVGKKS